ncbi:MAG: hypothetical protein K2W95_10360 [Candidatus Obscuribacterales bacterium]|nr:hypothetical protein [Candidatus Obscuribacterales bacterium]
MNLEIRNKLLIPVLILTVLLGGFILMRFVFPNEYRSQEWPATKLEMQGQKLVLKLHTDRTPDAQRLQLRDLDGFSCTLICEPDGGSFAPDFITFMKERAAVEPKPALIFQNRQGYIVHKPVPVTFTPQPAEGQPTSYLGKGFVVLSPHAGPAQSWSIDWTGKNLSPQ